MLRNALLAVSAGAALAALAGSASASQIDLSSYVTSNLNTYFNGGVYPPNGGPITIGGVDFNLNSLPTGGTGVVQLSGDDSKVIAVGEAGVTTVYSIVNSAFGQVPGLIGSMTFTGSLGATYTYNFTEGDNVRDHATTFYNTSAPNVFATQDFGGGDRLDVQKIDLPVAFGSQTLTSITFTSYNTGDGDPFLAALTTAAGDTRGVPEPATWALMIGGFGLAGAALRRRRAGAAHTA